MSAWIASDEHIIAVVATFVELHNRNSWGKPISNEDMVKMANTLKRENYRSVNYRYSEKARCAKIKDFEPYQPYGVSIMDAIKLAHSLEYQSCECNNYFRTKAHKLIWQIINYLQYRYIVDFSGEWDSAKWSM